LRRFEVGSSKIAKYRHRIFELIATQLQAVLNDAAELELEVDRLRRRDQFRQHARPSPTDDEVLHDGRRSVAFNRHQFSQNRLHFRGSEIQYL
jgi:hypothetical protein